MQTVFGFVDHAKRIKPQKRLISVVESKSAGGRISFGKDGRFPNEHIELYYASPTARRCVEVRESFTIADGFMDAASANLQINPYQTADDLLAEIATHVSPFSGFALVVRRDMVGGQGIVTSTHCLPIANITHLSDKTFAVNPRRIGQNSYKKDEDKIYTAFNPSATQEEIEIDLGRQMTLYGEQIGQVAYCYTRKPGQEHYPLSPGYSAWAYMAAEAEYAKVELNKVANGLFLSGIIETERLSKDNKTDALGKEIPDSSELATFEGQLRDMMGSEGTGGLLHLQTEMGQGRQISTSFTPLTSNADATDSAAKNVAIAKQICRAWGVPPVLAQIDALSGIGDTKQIVDEITYFNYIISKEQALITKALTMIYPLMDWTITTSNPIRSFPPEVIAKMTDEEVRQMAGLPPVEAKTSTQAQQVLTALNSLSPLVATKVLESMSQQQILDLVGLQIDSGLAPTIQLQA